MIAEPIDTKDAPEIEKFCQVIVSCLKRDGVQDFFVFPLNVVSDTPVKGPSILVLSTTPPTSIGVIPPDGVNVIIMQSTPRREAQNDLLSYSENVGPGAFLGPVNRPDKSFSAGWWVRDKGSGSMFNLTCAHAFKRCVEYEWKIECEGIEPVASPPRCKVSATILSLQRQILAWDVTRFESKDAAYMAQCLEVQQSIAKLKALSDDMIKFGTVVHAIYGDYPDESSVTENPVVLRDDWALIRPFHQRIGSNILEIPPSYENIFQREYTKVGQLHIGSRVAGYGSQSGFRTGVIVAHHESQQVGDRGTVRRWLVASSDGQDFSQKGDSGGPVIMEGGLAAGIILGRVGARWVDADVHFNCSWILPLTEIFPRIKIMTGRDVEIPTQVDLRERSVREIYHFQKTGELRKRELKSPRKDIRAERVGKRGELK